MKTKTVIDPNVSVPSPAIVDRAWLIERLAIGNYIHTATAIVRTSAQKTLGGYRLDLPHTGDLDMWLRFALHGNVAYVAERQAAYRRHDRNMSTQLPDLCRSAAMRARHFHIIIQISAGACTMGRCWRRGFVGWFARKMREDRPGAPKAKEGQMRSPLLLVMRGRLDAAKTAFADVDVEPDSDLKANAHSENAIGLQCRSTKPLRLVTGVVIHHPDLVNLYGCSIGANTQDRGVRRDPERRVGRIALQDLVTQLHLRRGNRRGRGFHWSRRDVHERPVSARNQR